MLLTITESSQQLRTGSPKIIFLWCSATIGPIISIVSVYSRVVFLYEIIIIVQLHMSKVIPDLILFARVLAQMKQYRHPCVVRLIVSCYPNHFLTRTKISTLLKCGLHSNVFSRSLIGNCTFLNSSIELDHVQQ